MGLPKITIIIGNGNLGQVAQTGDGISGLILSGAAVSGKVQLDTPYLITSLEGAEDLGIESTGTNAFAHRQISKFYEEPGNGAQLYIMLTDSDVAAATLKTGSIAPALLDFAKGAIRLLGVSIEKPASPTISEGLDANVHTAVTNIQALAEEYAGKYKPIRCVVDGSAYDGTLANLKDYKTTSNNRAAILLSGEDNDANADVGALLGLLASLPVQRKISRVKNGAIADCDSAHFTDTETVEENESDWDGIHDKGYIFHRTHAGKAGYFFSSDVTCTADTDDYNSLAKGRVIDKALVLAYGVLLERLSDEVTISADGTIPLAVCKDWQADVSRTINTAMVANGEASDVQVLVDPNQNVLSTNKVVTKLRVLPVGYSDYIDVELGFTTQTT